VRGQDSPPWLRIMLDEVLELVDVGVLGGFAGRHCADLAVTVQWPAAWTLNDSTPESPVISVLPEPDVAMSLGRLPESPFWLVFEMLKLVAWQLPSEQSLLP